MASLAEFRKAHPEYNDMGDVELADSLHAKFYSDIPKGEFDKQLGIRTSQVQGFIQGAENVAHNLRFLNGFTPGAGLVEDLTHKASAEGIRRREDAGVRSGGAGKFFGGLAASAPLALVGGPAVSGAAQGYATSEAKTPLGRAADAAIGAAGGKIAGAVLSRIGKTMAPVADEAVTRLRAAGVKLTPGQIKGGHAMAREDKAMSQPRVGERIADGRRASITTYNVASVDEALKPLGIKVPRGAKAGHDAINFAHGEVEKAYGQIVPRLAVQLDNRAVAAGIAPAVQTLPKAQQTQLKGILSSTIRNGQLQGQALKDAQGELRRLASTYSTSAAPADREMGRVLWQVDNQLSAAMLKQNPEMAPALQRVNRAFRGLAIMEDAASRADEGIASTGQIKQAVIRADKSRRKSASARGQAFMQDWSEAGRKVLPSTVPDTGTAGRRMAANRNLFQSIGDRMAEARYITDAGVTNLFADAPPAVRIVGQGLQRLSDPFGRSAAAAVANRPK